MSLALETSYSALGKAIRVTRESVGLNQAELAEASKMDPTEVSRLESGHRNPTLKKMWRLAGALGVPLSRILNLEELFRQQPDAPELASKVLRGRG